MNDKSDLELLTDELMQDEEFRNEYEKRLPDMEIKRAMLKARIDAEN